MKNKRWQQDGMTLKLYQVFPGGLYSNRDIEGDTVFAGVCVSVCLSCGINAGISRHSRSH